MKKISIALAAASLIVVPLLASAQVTATSTITTTPARNVACIQTAIEKRETALIAGHNTFNTSIVNALTVRKDGLKSAYALTEKGATKTAKKATWSKFKTDTKAAHDSMRSVRKASWNTFNTDMRACGVTHDETPHAVLNPAVTL
jgi:hypothetical protein